MKQNLLVKPNYTFERLDEHHGILRPVSIVELERDISTLLVALAYAELFGIREVTLAELSVTIAIERFGAYLDGEIGRDELFQ